MRKLLIVLLVLTYMLGLAGCSLKLPQHLPCAEDAFYELYPKDTVININETEKELSLISVVTDKYDMDYAVTWKSSDEELAEIEKREEGVFVLLKPTKEAKEFTLTATITDDDGDKVTCTVTYNLHECVHSAGPAATCTTDQKCKACGKVLKEATGHKAGPNPTCDEPQRCTVCNTVLKSELGHTPANDDGDCTTAVKCTRTGCGAITTQAMDAHVDENLDGKCDNCTVVVGITVDSRKFSHEINHNTIYHFNGVARISGTGIKVYTDNTKREEIILPYDLNGNESLYIEAVSENAVLYVGDRHTIPENEFEIGKGRKEKVNSDGYITYFTGYEGKFALYFGENDNAVVQMYIDGVFQDITDRYTFDLAEGEVASFRLAAKNGETEIEFTIYPVPVAETEYYLGITTESGEVYFDGGNAYGAPSWLSMSAENGVAVKLEAVEGVENGYRLYFDNNGVKTYIRMYAVSAGKRAALQLTPDKPNEYYTYNDEYRTLVFTDGQGMCHFLGSVPGDNVIASYQWGKITENDVVHFYLYN